MSLAHKDLDSTSQFALRRWRRIAIVVSVIAHIGLLSALAMWYVGKRKVDDRARVAAAVVQAELAAQAKAELGAKRPSPEVRPAQVVATLTAAQEKFIAAPVEEQLGELERQAAKLENVATEESVAEIDEKFEQWIPTPQRASVPAPDPVAGEFDFDTAQIHDVLRTAAEDGAWNYRSVLVDAQGRTFEVEIDRMQGEKAYATFESLKKFPLANRVYRQIAMGLIDKALQDQRNAKPPPTVANPPATETKPPEPSLPGENPGDVDDRNPFDNSDSP